MDDVPKGQTRQDSGRSRASARGFGTECRESRNGKQGEEIS